MKITINKVGHDLPTGATLADAVEVLKLAPPFAAAVNMQFVPKSRYALTELKADDDVEIIRPVTGG